MIDIHSHILPGLDDGAQTMKDTLEMADLAARKGITAMIATPHCNNPGGYRNYFSREYVECIKRVRKVLWDEGIPLRILPGAEVLGTSELPELLKDGRIVTLNQSRYLLVEFLFQEDPIFVDWLLDEIRELKYIPVIAHAERYEFVKEDPNLVYEWRCKGYPVQINKESFRGKFGTQTQDIAYTLLDHNLVSVVASDAHGPIVRTPNMMKTYERLAMEYSEEYLDMLFYENPRRICQDEPILGLKARMIE